MTEKIRRVLTQSSQRRLASNLKSREPFQTAGGSLHGRDGGGALTHMKRMEATGLVPE